ncbi:MAG: ATP-binding protein [Candidatus Hydrogenedentota bacterium]|nr:MAG: ATP-binding protein [Candidatus Hydrogenedentota bacterium]
MLLREFPAVGILGARQVGKTTLALQLAKKMRPKPVYLDLERPSDLAKLADPEQYFDHHFDRLLILDEIHRVPEIFRVLRGAIDARRRAGRKAGHFLILGSASGDLLNQSAESLAGRIAYRELPGFTVLEVPKQPKGNLDRLWLRGGFPESFLAKSDSASMRWRENLISTYLERDIPQFGSRVPPVTMRRFWMMLAHCQGQQINAAKLAASLGVSGQSVRRYLDLLEGLLLIRTLRPWAGNLKKRLVKTPKVYIRDSGLVHSLLGITTLDDLFGHPVAGASWEGFVMENILAVLPPGTSAWFYRSSAAAEIDLVISRGVRNVAALEIKRSLSPTVSKGFRLASADINAERRYLVYPGKERYGIPGGVIVIPLCELVEEARKW